MSNGSTNSRDLAAVQRGQIIQHVLVDGWTPEQAGAPFGIDERQVARWVAAYRRYGMASLRGETPVEPPLRSWIGRFLARLGAGPGGRDDAARPVRCIVLRTGGDDHRPLPGPGRRSHWN